MMKENDLIIETLLSIKDTIEKNQIKYKQIINMFNHDIEKCEYCEGTGNYKSFVGIMENVIVLMVGV